MAVGFAPVNNESPTSHYVGLTGLNANTAASEGYYPDLSPLAFGGVSVTFSSHDEYIEALIISRTEMPVVINSKATSKIYLTAAKFGATIGLLLFVSGLPLAFLKPDAIGALPFFLGGLLWFISGYIGRAYDK